MKERKKLLNFRLPFTLFLTLAAAVAFVYAVYYFNIDKFYLLTAVPAAAVVFTVCTFVFRDKRRFFICLSLISAFFLGVFCAYLAFSSYDKSEAETTSAVIVVGSVADAGSGDGYRYLVLDGATADGVALGGKVLAYLKEGAGETCAVGDTVRFTSTLDQCDLFVYGSLNYRAADGIKYTCTVTGGLTGEEGFSLFGGVRSAINGVLTDHLYGETAAVAYAMMTGNTAGMDAETVGAFRYGGIAHIFAVSGLHIGVLYAALTLLMKKLRVNKVVAAAVKIAFIVLYSGVCGFTSSSVRAVVMCACSQLCRLFHVKYDSLNALSFAGIVLLLVCPFNLFDLGFRLSFAAVFGIIFLSRFFSKLFRRLPRKLASALSVTLSAQLAVLPVQIAAFGYVSWAGLFLNLLVLPLLSAVYVVLFSSCILCLIVPVLAQWVLPAVCLPLEALMSLIVSCGLENTAVGGIGGWLLTPAAVLIVAALTDKINFRRLTRLVLVTATCAALALYLVARDAFAYCGTRVIVGGYYGGGAVVVTSRGETALIVTEGLNANRLTAMLSCYGCREIDAVVILGGEDCAEVYASLGVDAPVVYLYGGYLSVGAAEGTRFVGTLSFRVGNADYEFADGYSLTVSTGGMTFAVCASDDVPVGRADVLISSSAIDGFDAAEKICFGNEIGKKNIYDCGDLQFWVGSGRLYRVGLSHFVDCSR